MNSQAVNVIFEHSLKKPTNDKLCAFAGVTQVRVHVGAELA